MRLPGSQNAYFDTLLFQIDRHDAKLVRRFGFPRSQPSREFNFSGPGSGFPDPGLWVYLFLTGSSYETVPTFGASFSGRWLSKRYSVRLTLLNVCHCCFASAIRS